MLQEGYHSGQKAAKKNDVNPYSLDPKEKYDFDPVEVFKDFVKTTDEKNDKFDKVPFLRNFFIDKNGRYK